jgi:hypothetical protein
MIDLLQIFIEIDPSPQLRSGPTGQIFTEGEPPGEGAHYATGDNPMILCS